MKLSRLHALALLTPLSLCTTALAQEPAPAVAPVQLSETMDMAAVIALLKQQQEELNAQRERLDAKASKITSLTQELGALRAAPGTEPIPQTTPAPAQTIASTPPAEQADGGRGTPELQEGAEDGTRGEQIDIAKTVQSKSESDKKSSKAIADAQTDDPTEELLDQFPGAWRLPGTNSAFRVGGYVRAAVVRTCWISRTASLSAQSRLIKATRTKTLHSPALQPTNHALTSTFANRLKQVFCAPS